MKIAHPAIVVSTSAKHRHESEISIVQLGGADICISESVRTLDVTIDITMSFDQHVDNICRTSFCHIRALRRLKSLVTTAYLKTVAMQ